MGLEPNTNFVSDGRRGNYKLLYCPKSIAHSHRRACISAFSRWPAGALSQLEPRRSVFNFATLPSLSVGAVVRHVKPGASFRNLSDPTGLVHRYQKSM